MPRNFDRCLHLPLGAQGQRCALLVQQSDVDRLILQAQKCGTVADGCDDKGTKALFQDVLVRPFALLAFLAGEPFFLQGINAQMVDTPTRWSFGKATSLYQKHFNHKNARKDPPEDPLLYVPTHTARTLDRLLVKAGIPKNTKDGKVNFHACRTAFVTMMFENGASVKEAQALARHATSQLTLEVYAKTRDERLHAVIERVAKNLKEDIES